MRGIAPIAHDHARGTLIAVREATDGPGRRPSPLTEPQPLLWLVGRGAAEALVLRRREESGAGEDGRRS